MSKYAALHIRLAAGEDRMLEANYGKIPAPAAVVLGLIEAPETVNDSTVRGLLSVSESLGADRKGGIHYQFAFLAPSDELENNTLEALVPKGREIDAMHALREVPGVLAVYDVTPSRPRKTARTTTETDLPSKAARNRAATLGLD